MSRKITFFYAVLIAVATGVDETAIMGHLHETWTESQVRFGVHHDEVFAGLESGHRVASRLGNCAGGFDEHARLRAIGHQSTVRADGKLAAPDRVDHLSRRRDHAERQGHCRDTGDCLFRYEVRDGDAFKAGSDSALVEEAFSHCAHSDEADPDRFSKAGQSAQGGTRPNWSR